MLPNVYGFSWSAGHVIFLSVFFLVAIAVASTVGLALVRVVRDFRARKLDRIRWLSDFHELPTRDRVCRHEFTGEFRHRTCERGFDCRSCETHAGLVARHAPLPAEDTKPFGLDYPDDRLYHRGHTWVRAEGDGTLTVGLDDFAARMIGKADAVDLPAPGTRIEANGPGWTVRRGRQDARVLAPVDGIVVETGGPDAGFYLRLEPVAPEPDTRHLLRGAEVRPWVGRELERLQLSMATRAGAPALADGGVLVADVPKSCPEADWDAIWGELFLQP